MSGYGWLAESALMPQKSKDIKVDSNSLVDLKIAILQKKEEQSGNFNSKIQKQKRKYESIMNQKNKGVEMRNKKDIEDQKNNKQVKNRLEDKASIYEKLEKKGKNVSSILVDFEAKKINNMTNEEKEDYEKLREQFYNQKQQELEKREQNIINGIQGKTVALTKITVNEEQERLDWEKEVLQQMQDGLDEDELDNQEYKKNLVKQSYDRIKTKQELEKLQEVINEEKTLKEKTEEIKRRKQEEIEKRKQKLQQIQAMKTERMKNLRNSQE
ncbi:hypothetical protein PPERSA_01874 [Pseudocohnilembus persalinus]|uniref:Uncharacterized protein n=1 Tax=Pseudocohnilembus persalinus TaxID=266149 RepID=A0A0V0R2J9_PSEPJ|nr:hypothetical protein PPERSA_01874 [Pseudocohnilembus persalinus]|eukprot:KRX08621.1 hypothetical protein PPERSA_01874 [Pseudocohnilembus persalinus]